jgi:hypothetical protein
LTEEYVGFREVARTATVSGSLTWGTAQAVRTAAETRMKIVRIVEIIS